MVPAENQQAHAVAVASKGGLTWDMQTLAKDSKAHDAQCLEKRCKRDFSSVAKPE